MRIPLVLLREYKKIADIVIDLLSFSVAGPDREKITIEKDGRKITLTVDLGELAGGEPVELRKGTTHIQWKLVAEATWIDLISIAEISGSDGLAGTNGLDGTDGREIEVQMGGGYLRYRYVGEVDWINIATQAILTGPAGAAGAAGAAATIAVGTVTTGAAGSSATVNNSGASSAATLDFAIPRGDTGAAGAPGAAGNDGAAATVAVGTVTTGAAGSSATVNNSGTSSAATLDFAIPKGDKGDTGAAGVDGEGAPLGVPLPFFGFDLPVNYVYCDGAEYSLTSDQATLCKKIGFASGGSTAAVDLTFTTGSSEIGWTAHGKAVGDVLGLRLVNSVRFSLASRGGVSMTDLPLEVVEVVDANTIKVAEPSVGTALTSVTPGTAQYSIYTTFAVPDLRDASALGRGDMGGSDRALIADYTTTVIGGLIGSAKHLLTGPESGVQDHRHGVRGAEFPRATGGGTAITNFSGSDKTGETDLSGDIDAGESHNNIGPSVVCNYIIRYQ